MASIPVVIQSSNDARPDNPRFIEQLKAIVGPHHVLTKPDSTLRYRTGFRFGNGPALAVVRPGNLVEQWRVLKARRTRSSSCRLPIPALPGARRLTRATMIATSLSSARSALPESA